MTRLSDGGDGGPKGKRLPWYLSGGAILVIAVLGFLLLIPDDPAPEQRLLASAFEANAEALRAQLPMEIDEITTMTAVRHRDTTFTYVYEVAIPGERLAALDVQTALGRQVRDQACNGPQLRDLLDAGARLVWEWVVAGGDTTHTEDVTLTDCVDAQAPGD